MALFSLLRRETKAMPKCSSDAPLSSSDGEEAGHEDEDGPFPAHMTWAAHDSTGTGTGTGVDSTRAELEKTSEFPPSHHFLASPRHDHITVSSDKRTQVNQAERDTSTDPLLSEINNALHQEATDTTLTLPLHQTTPQPKLPRGARSAPFFPGSNTSLGEQPRFEQSAAHSVIQTPQTEAITSAPLSADDTTTVRISPTQQQDTLTPAKSAPGTMGWANASQTHRWSASADAPDSKTETMSSSPPSPTDSKSERKDHVDDGHSVVSANSSSISSPSMLPQNGPDESMESAGHPTPLVLSSLGTPSTISTAPSTDDASGERILTPTLDRLTLRLDEPVGGGSLYPLPRTPEVPPVVASGRPIPARISGMSGIAETEHQHRRSLSWDDPSQQNTNRQFAHQMVHPLPDAHPQAWGQQVALMQPSTGHDSPRGPSVWGGNAVSPHTRIANFRRTESDTTGAKSEANNMHYPYSHGPQHDVWHRRQQFDHRVPTQHLNVDGRGGKGYPHPGLAGPYHGHGRTGYSQPQQQHLQTPTRGQGGRQSGQSPGRLPSSTPTASGGGPGHGPSTAGGQRSQAEVLKTLLRKKACLYEPGTSRAVALVAWLVGRELALEYGYFSRQHLQSGVHACVAQKIESGTITRTKVNRCMQIILNSCFHYIIPRPDGTEENGDAFRQVFASTVGDDSDLLRSLSEPWSDLAVDRESVLDSIRHAGEARSPQSTSSASPPASPQTRPMDGDGETKRAVLLCFNENVRSAEDVFRCHNEFIRDTANASNLHLSAQEWRGFFGREAASTPLEWGKVGAALLKGPSTGGSARKPDFLGEMNAHELSKFRTTWCAKRYDHDHDLCGFAHAQVNGGWLRRNPTEKHYSEGLCPSVRRVVDKRMNPSQFIVNQCENGEDCPFAHSVEEVLYHPNRYKRQVCPSQTPRGSACKLGDVCPHLHMADSSYQQPKRRTDARAGHKHSRQGSSGKVVVPPEGSPILYLSPAPRSSFDDLLELPGLQSLFRRNCSVVGAYLHGRSDCQYTYFGDDCTTSVNEEKAEGRQDIAPGRS